MEKTEIVTFVSAVSTIIQEEIGDVPLTCIRILDNNRVQIMYRSEDGEIRPFCVGDVQKFGKGVNAFYNNAKGGRRSSRRGEGDILFAFKICGDGTIQNAETGKTMAHMALDAPSDIECPLLKSMSHALGINPATLDSRLSESLATTNAATT